MGLLAAWHQGMAQTSRSDVDPMMTVLREGGPFYTRGQLAAYLEAAGVAKSGTLWAAERGVAAVGADNMAFDVMGPADPELNVTLPAHILLLVRAGIPIIENLNLEELAAANVTEFVFICLPLKMRGATGSPVRPIAIA